MRDLRKKEICTCERMQRGSAGVQGEWGRLMTRHLGSECAACMSPGREDGVTGNTGIPNPAPATLSAWLGQTATSRGGPGTTCGTEEKRRETQRCG